MRSGGGFVGEWTNLSGPRNTADAASTIADSTGLAQIRWGLGPFAGAQRVSISADGAADVVLEVNAHPGVVLVGVWSPQLTSAQDLPSDTIRIHATGLSADDVQEARGWLNDGKVVRLRGGYIRPGVGIDPNWVFHLDQALVRLAAEPMLATECVGSPPLTQAEVDTILTSPNSAFVCPWDLDVVGIEDVPAEYLDALAGG